MQDYLKYRDLFNEVFVHLMLKCPKVFYKNMQQEYLQNRSYAFRKAAIIADGDNLRLARFWDT